LRTVRDNEKYFPLRSPRIVRAGWSSYCIDRSSLILAIGEHVALGHAWRDASV
jgi:hypothetical protein